MFEFDVSIFEFFYSRLLLHCANETLRKSKAMEREPIKYCKGDGKVAFKWSFLLLDKVTFDEHGKVF